MNCSKCGRTDAGERCYRCESWLCEKCVCEYEGYLVCEGCLAEYSGMAAFGGHAGFEEDDVFL